MLKGISKIMPPELLKIMMEMGHGDEIVIGDGNFPGASHNARCVRCDGHGVPEILEAMLKLFPLDTYAKPVYSLPVFVMPKSGQAPTRTVSPASAEKACMGSMHNNIISAVTMLMILLQIFLS